MNTIYDGSFVLGNTNELTFSAGPGIKVDQPSAGIVRIGNDETVLYDNPRNHNVESTAEFIMSESLWNFHRAFIEFDNMEFAEQPLNMEIDIDVTTTATRYFTPMRNAGDLNTNIPYAGFYINEAGNIKYINRGLLYGPWNSMHHATGDSRGYRVRKVIGINRISGSNA